MNKTMKSMVSETGSAAAAAAASCQSCPTLCDPIDGSPPGSAVSGILQARTLEWVAKLNDYYALKQIDIVIGQHI